MVSSTQGDGFEYPGQLVFNGIFRTNIEPEESDVDKEKLKDRLTGRLYPYSEGRPGDPGKGYSEIDLSKFVEDAVTKGKINPSSPLVDIAENIITQEYIREEYDEDEVVNSEGESEIQYTRSRLRTRLYWDFPGLMFFQGAKQKVEKTVGDTRSALSVSADGGLDSFRSDGGTPTNIRLNPVDFDSHFLLWLLYKDYEGESIDDNISIYRITDAEAEGGEQQDFFGLSNQVEDSVDVVRSTAFIEAISKNKLPSMIEGQFSAHGHDLRVKVYDYGKVHLKAREDLRQEDDLIRLLISLRFLREFTDLRQTWGSQPSHEKYVPPTFIEELDNIADDQGVDISFSREDVVGELLDRRGESLSDWPNLDLR
jgi:hypothetical protein